MRQLTNNKHSHIQHLCESVAIKCKFCGSGNIVRYGYKNRIQQYLCRTCGRKFGEKDTLEYKKTPTAEIGTALSLFFNGLSLEKISEQLQAIYSDDIDPSTIHYWIKEYSQKAIDILKTYKPKIGNIWVVDETVIDINGKNTWFWDIIDEKTRFLLASHLSYARTIEDVSIVCLKAQERARKYPDFILSDKLKAYPKGIEQVFGKHAEHIKSRGFSSDINTNLIERFHSTLKERTKVLRGFKSLDTAKIILDGFIINYNFSRPHITLKDTTPAREAGINLPFNTWEGFLRFMHYNRKHLV